VGNWLLRDSTRLSGVWALSVTFPAPDVLGIYSYASLEQLPGVKGVAVLWRSMAFLDDGQAVPLIAP